MLDANHYLNEFERWKQLSVEISDTQILEYINVRGISIFTGLLKTLTLGDFIHPRDMVLQQDLAGRAKLLHEKEEIFQLSSIRKSTLEEAIKYGSFGISIGQNNARINAHRNALRTELNFYQYVAGQLGYAQDFGAVLALTSPFYQVRFIWAPWEVFNFGKPSEDNVLGVSQLPIISKEQVNEAIRIHTEFGAKYKHNPTQIYKSLSQN